MVAKRSLTNKKGEKENEEDCMTARAKGGNRVTARAMTSKLKARAMEDRWIDQMEERRMRQSNPNQKLIFVQDQIKQAEQAVKSIGSVASYKRLAVLKDYESVLVREIALSSMIF